ncbi:hypothetical protein ACTXT7_006937 [Hymenolepis weldensis]
MIGGYVRSDSTEVSTAMGTKVNADANVDACVETLQAIDNKPPFIESVANGGRPYVFQHDSAPSYKALKTQD